MMATEESRLRPSFPQGLTIRRKGSSSRRQSMEACAVPLNEKVAEALAKHEYNFVLSDPRLPDHPIVYASEGFVRMTEYSQEDVIGRNCRFLQGPDTDRRTVLEIRDAIREERSCQVKILNYTKSGKPFWNLFHLAPIYSREDSRVIHFIGVQTEISLAATSSETNLAESKMAKLGEAQEAMAAGTEFMKAAADAATPEDAGAGRKGSVTGAEDMEGVELRRDPMAIDGGDGRATSSGAGGEWQQQQRMDDAQPRTAVEPQEEDVRVDEALQGRAQAAVRAVVQELTEVAARERMSAQRCMELAESAAAGVVCSSLLLHLARIQQSFALADPNLPDTPIVHVSDSFLQLTGYSREEVVGRNCRFLQGAGTNQETVQELRQSIQAEKPCTVRILNYRKDGTPFWNSLHVSPVRRCDGKVAFFCGVQLDVSSADEHEPIPRDAGMSGRLKQLGAVGAVRVAVRGLQGAGLRRSSFSADRVHHAATSVHPLEPPVVPTPRAELSA